jgi:hypothetical protein
VDPQLDDVLKNRYSISFDVTDVPSSAFMTAGEAWLRCRSGELEASICGHGDYRGLWFIAVNVVRDFYSLHDREASPWDTWRQAGEVHWRMLEGETVAVDLIARSPDGPMTEIRPPWL